MRNRLFIFLLICFVSVSTSGKTISASVVEITTCKDIDRFCSPVERADVFGVDTEIIYCCVKLKGRAKRLHTQLEWIHIEGEREEFKNYTIDISNIKTSRPSWVAFALRKSKDDWPRGDYEARFSIKDKLIKTTKFRIE